MRHRKAIMMAIALTTALWTLPVIARADGFHASSMNYMNFSAGEYAGSKLGSQLGGMAGGAGAVLLAKDESTAVKIGAGLLGTAIGGAIGKSIGGSIGKKATGGLFRSLIDGKTNEKGVSLGVTYHDAPMATLGWKF